MVMGIPVRQGAVYGLEEPDTLVVLFHKIDVFLINVDVAVSRYLSSNGVL